MLFVLFQLIKSLLSSLPKFKRWDGYFNSAAGSGWYDADRVIVRFKGRVWQRRAWLLAANMKYFAGL